MVIKKLYIIILSVILFIIVNLSINKLFYNDYVVNNRYFNNQQFFQNVSEIYDLVILGNSHAERAFNFTYFDSLNAINLAMSEQDYYFDNLMLKSFENQLSDNSTIIINVSYHSFCNIYTNSKTRYLPFIEFRDLNMLYTEYLREKYLPLVGLNNTSEFIRGLLRNFKTDSLDDPFVLHKFDTYEEFIVNSERSIDYALQIMNCSEEAINENLNHIESILENQITNGNRIILLTPPYHEIYNYKMLMNNSLIEEWNRIINTLTEKYNLQYLNYSRDDRFENQYQFFLDDTHLNYLGAKMFTEIVLSDIYESK